MFKLMLSCGGTKGSSFVCISIFREFLPLVISTSADAVSYILERKRGWPLTNWKFSDGVVLVASTVGKGTIVFGQCLAFIIL